MPSTRLSLQRSTFAALGFLLVACGASAQGSKATPAPEFPLRSAEQWINSAPLTLDSLKGSVVLIDFWAYSCINCQRSIPSMSRIRSMSAISWRFVS